MSVRVGECDRGESVFFLSANSPLGLALLSKPNYLISTAGRLCVRQCNSKNEEDDDDEMREQNDVTYEIIPKFI